MNKQLKIFLNYNVIVDKLRVLRSSQQHFVVSYTENPRSPHQMGHEEDAAEKENPFPQDDGVEMRRAKSRARET